MEGGGSVRAMADLLVSKLLLQQIYVNGHQQSRGQALYFPWLYNPPRRLLWLLCSTLERRGYKFEEQAGLSCAVLNPPKLRVLVSDDE